MYIKKTLSIVALLALTGCAGLGAPFIKLRPDYSKVPEESLHAAAHAIEQAVLQGEREPQFQEFAGVMLDLPEIMQAIRTRAIRNPLIQEMLDAGYAYEQKSGVIALLRSRDYKRATTRQQRDQHALLIMSENQNRWTLYEGIVTASQWAPGALGAVQDSFFQARLALLKSGRHYENEAGEIVAK
jgi:hypothetical protein